MSITNYDELQTAIAAWLARGDLAAYIPDFIALAEQRIFHGAADAAYPSPPLRLRAMEQATDPATYQTAAGIPSLALPAGFLAARAVSLATAPPVDLDPVAPRQLNAISAGIPGRPRAYLLEGNALRLAPTPDAAYGVSLTYYRRFDPLTVTPTNWLLDTAPGVYLYAALLEAQPFLRSDARLPIWASMLGAATRALMAEDEQRSWGGQMAQRVDHPTP